ncbi:hypothetical protein [Polaromonas jejuensis]|uniref:RRM domain-containing protein n=1 Tax=Polaromonas jejuensis TaxID=457502 RepID=A0ABW0QD39_9BURK|nr:hypothetical protein [Polaromonas jejuensis]
MNNELDKLQHCPDLASLRFTLHRVCSRFGSVAQLKILPASCAGKQQALCFFRMASAEEEQQLMSGLGVRRFGGELVVVVDMKPSGPAMADLFGSAA